MKKIVFGLIFLSLFLYLPVKVFAGNPPVQSNSQYTTPSGFAPSDGTSTETINVHLQDSSQNVVAGDVISLSSSNDSTALFPQNNQTTDSNGNATFSVTTTTPGGVKITLFDSTNNVTFPDWFTVTFYDVAKGCSNVPPAPVLSSVVSNSDNKATLTWVNSANPVSNYLISYGTATKNYIYGNTNVGPQGTTSTTVGSLAGGKKYYFVVAANNNCGTSGFSNEVSAIVNPVPATVAPTVKPTTEPAIVTPTATPITTFVTNESTNTSQEVVDSPTPAPTTSDVNSTFMYLGIGIIAAGVIVISGVFIFQKIKNKNKIPPLSPPTISPPMYGNIPPTQQPTQLY